VEARLGMTSAGSQQLAAGRDPARAVARLRGSAMGLIVMLIIEFGLGSGVSLYVTLSKGGISKAFSNGPLLALHAALGVLLFLAAIDFLVTAIRAGRPVTLVAAIVGLIAIVGAAINGTTFVSNGQNGTSLGMAIAGCVALLSYAVALRSLVSAERAKA
jgi:hypothetical protein